MSDNFVGLSSRPPPLLKISENLHLLAKYDFAKRASRMAVDLHTRTKPPPHLRIKDQFRSLAGCRKNSRAAKNRASKQKILRLISLQECESIQLKPINTNVKFEDIWPEDLEEQKPKVEQDEDAEVPVIKKEEEYVPLPPDAIIDFHPESCVFSENEDAEVPVSRNEEEYVPLPQDIIMDFHPESCVFCEIEDAEDDEEEFVPLPQDIIMDLYSESCVPSENILWNHIKYFM